MRNTKLVAATFVIALAACMLSTDSAHAWRRYRTVWGPQPVMVAPQPVWVQQPQPVWVHPQPVVVNRPVWVQQPTVVRTYRAPRRAYRPVVIW